MNEDTLKDYASIRKCMTNVITTDDSILGKVRFSSENITTLNRLVSAKLCSAAVDLYKYGDLKVSKELPCLRFEEKFDEFEIQIELVSQKIHNKFVILKNWDELLSYQEFVLTPVHGVFFNDDLDLHLSTSSSKIFRNYTNSSEVCTLIKEVANDITASQDYLIIFGQSLAINFTLNASALEHEIDSEILSELLKADLHKEAKTALVRESLVSFLKQHDKKHRFTYLLKHFNAFSTQLLAGYEQYVNNYSFDKVRREYEEKKAEYTAKINKVFDDVATKTFALPAGVWLAASQIDKASAGTLVFYKNITFVFAVLVLGLIVCLNLHGQFSTLNAIKDEYEPLFKRLSNENGCDKSEVKKAKKNLSERYEIVWWKLALSILITIVLFITAVTLVIVSAA